MGCDCGGNTNQQGSTHLEHIPLTLPSPLLYLPLPRDVPRQFPPIPCATPNQHDTWAEHAHSGPRNQGTGHQDTRELQKRKLSLQPSEWDPTPEMAESSCL